MQRSKKSRNHYKENMMNHMNQGSWMSCPTSDVIFLSLSECSFSLCLSIVLRWLWGCSFLYRPLQCRDPLSVEANPGVNFLLVSLYVSQLIPDKGPSVQVGDSPLHCVFSRTYNPLVVGHRASDCPPKTHYWDKL